MVAIPVTRPSKTPPTSDNLDQREGRPGGTSRRDPVTPWSRAGPGPFPALLWGPQNRRGSERVEFMPLTPSPPPRVGEEKSFGYEMDGPKEAQRKPLVC